MNKNGIVSKNVYSNTEEGIHTQMAIQYNTRTDYIGFSKVSYKKTYGLGNGGSKTNKECSQYLGVTIAEKILSKIFKNVEVMPNGNPGFDFICGKGFKIDVKSAAKAKTQNAWVFTIKRNKIPNYFLCLAFDNRENLNPEHLWLISGDKVNHLTHLGIFQTKIAKWNQYELINKLDKVIFNCNDRR